MMTHFCPSIWEEDPTPTSLQTCGDCGLNLHGSRMIWGEGNPSARIMLLLTTLVNGKQRKVNYMFVEQDKPYKKQHMKLD